MRAPNPFHSLYNTHKWRKLRAAQLNAYPLCIYCERMGRVTQATVADHIQPHRGDAVKFYKGQLQSLCQTCHASVKQREELGKTVKQFDINGWPMG